MKPTLNNVTVSYAHQDLLHGHDDVDDPLE